MLVPCTRKAWATKVIRKKQKRTATARSWSSSQKARSGPARTHRHGWRRGLRSSGSPDRGMPSLSGGSGPGSRALGLRPSARHACARDAVVETLAREGDHQEPDAEASTERQVAEEPHRGARERRSDSGRSRSRPRVRACAGPVSRRAAPQDRGRSTRRADQQRQGTASRDRRIGRYGTSALRSRQLARPPVGDHRHEEQDLAERHRSQVDEPAARRAAAPRRNAAGCGTRLGPKGEPTRARWARQRAAARRRRARDAARRLRLERRPSSAALRRAGLGAGRRRGRGIGRRRLGPKRATGRLGGGAGAGATSAAAPEEAAGRGPADRVLRQLGPAGAAELAGSSTAVPHSAQTSLGGPAAPGASPASAAEDVALAISAPRRRAREPGRARVLDDLALHVQLDLVAEEEARAADRHEVAVAQALLAHPVAVDHRAVRRVAVADVVLAAAELDDRMPARDHRVGQHEVVRGSRPMESSVRPSEISRRSRTSG